MAPTKSSVKFMPANEAEPPVRFHTAYDDWTASLGIPIHKAFYVDDVRTLPLGWWEERQCYGAIVELAGMEHITEAKVTEIPAGKTSAPSRMAIDEVVYVADGRGVASLWADGHPKKTVEWSKHSLMLIPRNHTYQMSNTQGDKPVRLLHFSFLRIMMQMAGGPEIFFGSSPVNTDLLYGENGAGYSEAKLTSASDDLDRRRSNLWTGNFFPDMRAWDKLVDSKTRGGAGKTVAIQFPHSPISAHMAVFPPQYYKKAHRHSAGTVIVIPAGEGYSILWKEHGDDILVMPWHEGSLLVPPHMWWHQHFNIGGEPARYLAFHGPPGLPGEYFEDHSNRDEGQYTEEDPIIRRKFEEELAKRGLTSLMPEEAYQDRDFKITQRPGA